MSELSTRAEEVFHRVASAAPGDRGTLLDEACGGDTELHALVESLIEADREADSFFLRIEEEVAEGARKLVGGSGERTSSFATGERLGEFVLVREIGHGGMGVVWEATQSSIGRRVALKILPPERAWRPKSIERFRREAEAASRVDHPGIVAVHTVGSERDIHFIAQEYVEGARTLADRLDEIRRLPELPRDYDHTTARTFLAIAQALEAVHRNGVVHRDIKPTNVLLTPEGTPKVADFGLARLEGAPGLSLSGDLVGTPFYMSPEQASASRELDAQSDVFSLGATLYEALTLRRPFDGDTRREILERVEREEPVDPRRLRPRIPVELAVICLKAVEKAPRQRYASMAAFAEDLRRFLRNEPILAKSPTRWDRAVKWSRRNPTKSVAGAVATAAFVAISFLFAANVRANRQLRLTNADLDANNTELKRTIGERDAEIESVKRLSALQDLEDLIAEADDRELMWPPFPDRIERYKRWIERARDLMQELPVHRAKRTELLELVTLRAEQELGGLQVVHEEQTGARWWSNQLEKLIEGLEGLEDQHTGLLGEDACSPEHGWSVPKRLGFAERLRNEFASGGAWAQRWERDLPAIRAAYPGLELVQQMGLVPIGPDLHSKLWEFWHVASGEEPARGAEGELEPSVESGLVLVLLPGGTFWMGAQREDPQAPNYDPQSQPNELPVHRVSLGPFFVSKYEMTQSQWLHCTGTNPSSYQQVDRVISGPPLLHPVEQVNWFECDRVAHWLGLELPCEAQWEYAARAGTESPWWTGADRESLIGAANLADSSAVRSGYNWPSFLSGPEFDDGFGLHAPVGSLRPNPFGLHHVHGNVLEWCSDVWINDSSYNLPTGEGGERIEEVATGGNRRAYRGGCFDLGAYSARSAYRYNAHGEYQLQVLGLRPARSVDL